MNDYSEDFLVEQPAIELFSELDWQTANCFYEKFGEKGTIGRETTNEVVLVPRLRAALVRLNPDLPPEAIALAIEELTRDRSVMSPANANRKVYRLLKNGVKVSFRGKENEETVENVRVIDWNEPSNNDFFLASQFWVSGEMYKRRADMVGFVNGLPLIFIELKALHKRLEHAYRDNLRDYKNAIPQIFWYNGFIILSNGSQSKIGSMTAEWEHFAEWKKINSEGEEGIVSLDAILINDESKKKYLLLAGNVIQIYRAILPDPAANEFYPKQMLFAKIAEKIRFYLEKFQTMIDEYNFGSYNVETFFTKLVAFAQELNAEDKRGIAEKLTEEELAIFDLLIKPGMALSKKEKREVKKVAKELLETLKKEKLVLDWRKRQQSRAAVRVSIEDILERLPLTYTPELYHQKAIWYISTYMTRILGMGRVYMRLRFEIRG